MRHLSTWLWFLPFALHVGYALATNSHIPPRLGAGEGTISSIAFFEWFGVIGLANATLSFMHARLHKFDDKMLSVPGKAYWLSNQDRRAELVERLRGIIETSLLALNVFFLAVYQFIYQTVATRPILAIDELYLFVIFMGVPLLGVLSTMGWNVASFARIARDQLK